MFSIIKEGHGYSKKFVVILSCGLIAFLSIVLVFAALNLPAAEKKYHLLTTGKKVQGEVVNAYVYRATAAPHYVHVLECLYVDTTGREYTTTHRYQRNHESKDEAEDEAYGWIGEKVPLIIDDRGDCTIFLEKANPSLYYIICITVISVTAVCIVLLTVVLIRKLRQKDDALGWK